MSFTVRGNFFYKFKTGDNIQYNLECLRVLYEQRASVSETERHLFIKPIILIEVAIIEAILHDLHLRASMNIWEGVLNLKEEIATYIRGKKIDEFISYIDSAKKHDLFSEPDSSFYARLHELREKRNRIHIQNTKNYTPINEIEVFTERVLISSERCLERVVKTMSQKYYRQGELGNYVGDLRFPWPEHFPSTIE